MQLFKNMTIGRRLNIGFAIILLSAMALLIVSIWRLQIVADTTRAMMEKPLAKERLVADWYRNIHTSVRRTMAIAKTPGSVLSTYFDEDAKLSSKETAERQNALQALISTDQERALMAELQPVRQNYINARDAISLAKNNGQEEEAGRILETAYKPASQEYLALLQRLLDLQRSHIDSNAASIYTLYTDSRMLLIVLGGVLLVSGWLFSWRLAVSITRPLKQAVDLAQTVAAGDLSSKIVADSQDETGKLLQALNRMNGSLLNIVGQVRAGTDTMATASSQIASGNLDLSARTESEAGALEETASAMEQLTATVKQNADNAREASDLAVSAAEVAVQGGSVVEQVVTTMGEIHTSSKKIVDIISVIDGIAFQTNILALNASVEAARAGEQGRGFAVVAGEVRSLAQRSASAAKEIKELIANSVDKIDFGSRLVEQAGHTMSEVVTSVQRVTDIVREISIASQEQRDGIEQVNRAINQMDETTQQNAALVEQAAAAADSLQDQAKALTEVVSIFKLETLPAEARSPVRTVDITPRSSQIAARDELPKLSAAVSDAAPNARKEEQEEELAA